MFLLRRVAVSLLTIFALVTIVFFAARLAGDPILLLAGPEATAARVEELRALHGLDRPVIVQYFDYIFGLLQGDAGNSWRWRQPVETLVFNGFVNTAKIAIIGIVLGVVVALPLGIVSALKPGSVWDSTARVIAVATQSMPVFWSGILLIIIFSVQLQWLPSGGGDSWQSLILPGIALSAYGVSLTTRLTRSSMREVLSQEWVITARSKGLSEFRVVRKHVLRNALIPIITIVALQFGHILGGAVTLEVVFSYPGIGNLAMEAVAQRDFPLIQFFVIFAGAIVVIVNLIADVLYSIADPRVRIS